jgi:hypothetical protein
VDTLGSPLLTAAEFLNDTTAPTWNNAKQGWYNGSDLCIFAVYETGGVLLEFYHDADDYVVYADTLACGKTSKTDADTTTWDIDTTFIDCYIPMPDFATKATLTAWNDGYQDAHYFYWRTNGQTGATGHIIGYGGANGQWWSNTFEVIGDASGIVEFKCSRSGTESINVYCEGWYFPIGV